MDKQAYYANKFVLNLTRVAVFGNFFLIFVFVGALVTCGTCSLSTTLTTAVIALVSTMYCVWRLFKMKSGTNGKTDVGTVLPQTSL